MSESAERVTVSTYVPEHQRDRWAEHADALDMSQSEFVRSMVQAGRRGFSLGGERETSVQPGSTRVNPRGNELKSTILELLEEEGPLGWAELVEELTGDLESDLESALLDLQSDDRIQHSPREGNYAVASAPDGS